MVSFTALKAIPPEKVSREKGLRKMLIDRTIGCSRRRRRNDGMQRFVFVSIYAEYPQ